MGRDGMERDGMERDGMGREWVGRAVLVGTQRLQPHDVLEANLLVCQKQTVNSFVCSIMKYQIMKW